MDKLRRSFRESFRKHRGGSRGSDLTKPQLWQQDEAAVRAGTCTFPVKVFYSFFFFLNPFWLFLFYFIFFFIFIFILVSWMRWSFWFSWNACLRRSFKSFTGKFFHRKIFHLKQFKDSDKIFWNPFIKPVINQKKFFFLKAIWKIWKEFFPILTKSPEPKILFRGISPTLQNLEPNFFFYQFEEFERNFRDLFKVWNPKR